MKNLRAPWFYRLVSRKITAYYQQITGIKKERDSTGTKLMPYIIYASARSIPQLKQSIKDRVIATSRFTTKKYGVIEKVTVLVPLWSKEFWK